MCFLIKQLQQILLRGVFPQKVTLKFLKLKFVVSNLKVTLNRFFLLGNGDKNRTWKKERFVRFLLKIKISLRKEFQTKSPKEKS